MKIRGKFIEKQRENKPKPSVDFRYLRHSNRRRLWRPRHSLSKLPPQIINNKNAQTNCTDYGGDAIAS